MPLTIRSMQLIINKVNINIFLYGHTFPVVVHEACFLCLIFEERLFCPLPEGHLSCLFSCTRPCLPPVINYLEYQQDYLYLALGHSDSLKPTTDGAHIYICASPWAIYMFGFSSEQWSLFSHGGFPLLPNFPPKCWCWHHSFEPAQGVPGDRAIPPHTASPPVSLPTKTLYFTESSWMFAAWCTCAHRLLGCLTFLFWSTHFWVNHPVLSMLSLFPGGVIC